MATVQEIKELRDMTGLSIMECQKALEEAGGDKEQAIAILKSKGAAVAAKKGGRNLGAGVVSSYIHASGKVGAMVELLCETDFVAKNPEFKASAYDIAMHIAAMNPADKKELMEQAFIKDSGTSIEGLVNAVVQKFGERTEVGEFVRFSIN